MIHVNSGYLARPEATFWWTVALGLAIGLMYSLLRDGTRGRTSWIRSVRFALTVFGPIWALFNFFMPIVFNMSFIDFEPPLLNYVWRVVVDIICVMLGAWIADRNLSHAKIDNYSI